MKQSKTMVTKVVAVAVAFSMALAVGPVAKVDAAKKKPKLNKTKATVENGKSFTLKVKKNGNKISKVTWKSTDKNVATVSSKGKVKAKGVGSATIKATVKVKGAKKKTTLKCKVKVYDWETVENTEVGENVQDALKNATEELTGATYEAVALLAEQFTVGQHCRVLCKITYVTPDAKPFYAIIDLDLEKNDFDIYADTNGIVEALPTSLPGGMVQTDDPMIPAIAKPVIDSYVSTNNIPYNPVAIVGKQVVSATLTNYLVICERKEPSGKMGYALVNLSVDGITPTIGDIFPFTFGKDYSVCTDYPANEVEKAAATIRNAVAKGDFQTISGMIAYPITTMTGAGEEIEFKSAEEFLAKVNEIGVNPDFIAHISSESCVDLFANSDGICMCDGEIWLNEKDGAIKITSLNTFLGTGFAG